MNDAPPLIADTIIETIEELHRRGLKPCQCPFCAADSDKVQIDAKVWTDEYEQATGDGIAYAVCDGCNATGPAHEFSWTEDRAAAILSAKNAVTGAALGWNRRMSSKLSWTEDEED